MHSFTITGQLVDLFTNQIYPVALHIEQGRIHALEPLSEAPNRYILPGFVDAHVHIESSLLTPAGFARMAVVHGTLATVSDPHEIANVCGAEGVQFMIEDAARSPFKFCFGAPSCVPATAFETAGASLDPESVEALLRQKDIYYLAEMMNYPGVLHQDADVMTKITAAHKLGKPVDGHAPGLMGAQARAYAAAGITTDHECFSLAEALDKIQAGMHILIREGSAARNFDTLAPLLRMHPRNVMFCSDDKHPDSLLLGHINQLVARALALGYDLYDVLRAASHNPVLHYRLPVGLLRPADPADFIVVEDLVDFRVLQTWIGGQLVAEAGSSLLPQLPGRHINNFHARPIQADDLALKAKTTEPRVRVIDAIDGQLVTASSIHPGRLDAHGCLISNPAQDILKMVVINRYQPDASPAIAFVRHFGLRQGAIASSVAHDCHNIIAVGVDDASIAAAVNALIACKGGLAVARDADTVSCLPLPVAGLMSTDDGYEVARQYTALDAEAKALGATLQSPFMTLSFMALLVIPSLKLSDRGLFDGSAFSFTSVELEA